MENGNGRKQLYDLLGDLPPRQYPVACKMISEEDKGQYILQKLVLDLNGTEPVPAYFAKPKNAPQLNPTIVYNHSHGGNYSLGKDELIRGNVYLQETPYAEALTKKGYSALCIDLWGFGERIGRSESEIFKQMLWSGQVMWGMMVYDSIRAIDYLISRSDVDPGRIATLGMSMGSTMAWWLAALDTRIKVCVDICCLTDFQSLIETRNLDGHGIFYYVPKLLKYFTTVDINALIAPRPHLSVAGIYDRLTPPSGLDRIDVELKDIYRREGADDAWKLSKYSVGHFETAEMRAEILDFLERWL